MIEPFVFSGFPTRIVFGAGKVLSVAAEANRLGMSRPLVLTGQQQSTSGRYVGNLLEAPHWDGARMHTPIEVTENALSFFNDRKCDGVVSFGGGSSIGLGKALALRTDCLQLCVPTTFAGSEMTNILGETAQGSKTTKRDPRIQPEAVIYDPDLVAGLPPRLAATSGMNAIAHAVEGLYAIDGNPVVSLMAEEAIRALARALPKYDNAGALYGAWLCGAVLGSVSMALHHKLCHVLGGSFNLPHSETHAVILPHATAYNAEGADQAMARICCALGTSTAAGGLFDLVKQLGAPTTLKELGMPEEGLDKVADIAVSSPYPNPRALERKAIRQILDNAFHGRRPD